MIEKIERAIEEIKCPDCQGSGFEGKFKCSKCRGTGVKEADFIEKIEGKTKEWIWNPRKNALINKNGYRVVQAVRVVNSETNERHEDINVCHRRGEIDIVINDKGEIAFVIQYRPGMINFDYINEKWKDPPEIFKIPHGEIEIALTRGMSNKILEEAEEETRLKVKFIDQIGNVNSDSAIIGTSPPVFICKATKVPTDVPPDSGEKILKVLWLAPEEIIQTIADGDIFDLFTLGTLMLFMAWAKIKQDDPFIKSLAARF